MSDDSLTTAKVEKISLAERLKSPLYVVDANDNRKLVLEPEVGSRLASAELTEYVNKNSEYIKAIIDSMVEDLPAGFQWDVYTRVEERGYTKKKDGTDWPEGVFEWRQWEKALEEMREVYGYLAADPGGNQEQVMFELDLDRAVHFANTAFRNQGFVYNTSEGLHSPTKDWCRGVIEECADVVIPLLCLAETMRRRFPSLPSLMQMVAEKSAADVKRGVSK